MTHSSQLLPVRRYGVRAMLKVAIAAEEKRGGLLMTWWDGRGAARVLAHDHGALLLEVVLHGDIHHGNILDFGERGWLAIDPKCLIGERGFDYANIFCNPDRETATAPGRLARQVYVVAEAAGLERTRLLKWILAWAGLSAV